MSSRSRAGSRSSFILPVSRSDTKGPTDKAKRNTEVAVTKGLDGNDVFTIELNGIVQRLQRLRANANRNIKSLTGQLKDDFQALAYYVQLLYDSPEYEVLYSRIRTIFGDLTELRPGTIGAYFGGCLNRNPTMGSCALTCVDAAPSSDADFRFCDTLVLWAVWDGRSYQISPINAGTIPNDRRRQAYIFLEVADYGQFPGFTEAEKATIRRFGVEEVQFVRYTQDGRQYQRLSAGFIELDSPLIRVRGVDPLGTNGEPVRNGSDVVVVTHSGGDNAGVVVAGGNGGMVLVIVLVVILLVLIVFFGYRYWGTTEETVVIDNLGVGADIVTVEPVNVVPSSSVVTIDRFGSNDIIGVDRFGMGGRSVMTSASFMPLL